MSLKSAMFNGVSAAKQQSVNLTEVANKVADLAEALSKIKDGYGEIFFYKIDNPDWGTTIQIGSAINRDNAVEFEFFEGNPDYTVYTPLIQDVSKRGTVQLTTEQEGLELLTNWAGKTAPEYAKDLAEVIDSFELQRSIQNGEWGEAPHHQ